MGHRRIGAVLACLTIAFAAGCDGEPDDRISLAAWRSAFCAAGEALDERLDGTGRLTAAEEIAALRATVARLRQIPLPESHETEARRFLALYERSVEVTVALRPRLEAVERRLRAAMRSVDPTKVPPKKDGETVAGSIMGYLLTVPAYRAAWEELAALEKAAQRRADTKTLLAAGTALGVTDATCR